MRRESFEINPHSSVEKLADSVSVRACVRLCACMCVGVHACVCVCISFQSKGFSLLKQNNECNARDQARDVVLRKLLRLTYLYRHVINHNSRDLQLC